MGRGTHLGEFELIVLAAVLRLGPDAYGVAVRREIEAHTERSVAIGSVYKTLERLERKGFVASRIGDPSPRRGGRAKRHFEVTAAGRGATAASVRDLEAMFAGLELGWGAR